MIECHKVVWWGYLCSLKGPFQICIRKWWHTNVWFLKKKIILVKVICWGWVNKNKSLRVSVVKIKKINIQSIRYWLHFSLDWNSEKVSPKLLKDISILNNHQHADLCAPCASIAPPKIAPPPIYSGSGERSVLLLSWYFIYDYWLYVCLNIPKVF